MVALYVMASAESTPLCMPMRTLRPRYSSVAPAADGPHSSHCAPHRAPSVLCCCRADGRPVESSMPLLLARPTPVCSCRCPLDGLLGMPSRLPKGELGTAVARVTEALEGGSSQLARSVEGAYWSACMLLQLLLLKAVLGSKPVATNEPPTLAICMLCVSLSASGPVMDAELAAAADDQPSGTEFSAAAAAAPP